MKKTACYAGLSLFAFRCCGFLPILSREQASPEDCPTLAHSLPAPGQLLALLFYLQCSEIAASDIQCLTLAHAHK